MWGEYMGKQKRFIGYTLIIVLVIIFFVYIYPKKIDREINAIMYRLGDSHYSENIQVDINGYFSKGLLKGDRFEGVMTIGENKLTKINLRFDKFNRGLLFCYDENTGDYTSYGDMYSDQMMKEFTICILEEDIQGKGGKTWSPIDGLMVAAPANNRVEAIDMSNKLMKDVFDNTVFDEK